MTHLPRTLHALQEALRELEQYARVEQTVGTRALLRDEIGRLLDSGCQPVVPPRYAYKRPVWVEPRHVKDSA